MIKRLPASFLLILCMSFLIGKGSSFCQEKGEAVEEKKEAVVSPSGIPYGIEINKDLLPSYEMAEESLAVAFDPFLRYIVLHSNPRL